MPDTTNTSSWQPDRMRITNIARRLLENVLVCMKKISVFVFVFTSLLVLNVQLLMGGANRWMDRTFDLVKYFIRRENRT